MNDPKRLLAGIGGDEDAVIARALLGSASKDAAPKGAEARVLAALGLGSAVVTAAALEVVKHTPAAIGVIRTNAPAASATSATTATVAAPLAAKVGAIVFVKWIGIAVIAVAAAGGSFALVKSNGASRDAASGSVGGAAVVHAPATSPPMPASAPPPQATVESAPTIELDDDAPIAQTAPRNPSAVAPSSSATLGQELVLLDRARRATQAKDAAGANAALDEYARAFPRGTLREEATVARIDALLTAGESALAITKADAFLREHPGSAYAPRVVALKKRALAEEASRSE